MDKAGLPITDAALREGMRLVIGSRHCDEEGQGRTCEHGRHCSHLCRRS